MITVDYKRLRIQNSANMLDIGCGSGRHLAAAVGYREIFAVGTDRVFETLKEAAARLLFQKETGEQNGAWALCVSDINHLPFSDSFFDAMICAEVLEHIRDEKTVLTELHRILKPGRILAVSVPRFFPEWICWQISRAYRTAENGHIRIYQKKDLITRVEEIGFVLKGYHYAHSLHTPYWWLKCLLGPSRTDAIPVNLYHRFLTWEIFRKPRIIRRLDRLLNPILGKSLVLYFQKHQDNLCSIQRFSHHGPVRQCNNQHHDKGGHRHEHAESKNLRCI